TYAAKIAREVFQALERRAAQQTPGLILGAGSIVDEATAALFVAHGANFIVGPTFNLRAKAGHLSTPDGHNLYFWGFANGAGPVQYPGPTLIVNQGQTITVNLVNDLTELPVSIVFPGQRVTPSGGSPGLLTREAVPGGGTASYTFIASRPGTFMYHSGTRPDLAVEMGLVGALIVRPTTGGVPIANQAYAHPDSAYDHEYLYLLTEMDESIHTLVEQGRMSEVNTAKRFPVYWFINGRCGPDTVAADNAVYLPTQPYSALTIFSPGDKVLMRVIGAGQDSHPLHHHGNNALIIARNASLLQSTTASGADLGYSVFTIPAHPGETTDALFSWTGEKLGWDVYGHAPDDVDNAPLGWSTGGAKGAEDIDHDNDGVYDTIPLEPHEYAADHGKPFPVTLPGDQDLTFGMFYSGSPFLGGVGSLPPGEGGFNPSGGFMYMWHSHNERELINNNIFPGGMLTMALVEAHPPAP
ncbi:MAG TPA: multicopper oxidase domain-containing protein, partial [Candidatus Paceibacterota bacterium]|nr:multicopper oxidase domain-containing protein [Candidatus Paceibacterota bacterium]